MNRRDRSRRGTSAGEGAENGTVTPTDEDADPPTLGASAWTAPTPARRGPSCQADRCGVDLTNAKQYHRRHKVCDAHANAPVVIVAGLRQRFCQQCSRFQELSEFDDVKKSCRQRLAGHNQRRRKSTADPSGGSGNSGGGAGGGNGRRHADQDGRLTGNPLLIR